MLHILSFQPISFFFHQFDSNHVLLLLLRLFCLLLSSSHSTPPSLCSSFVFNFFSYFLSVFGLLSVISFVPSRPISLELPAQSPCCIQSALCWPVLVNLPCPSPKTAQPPHSQLLSIPGSPSRHPQTRYFLVDETAQY